MKHWKLAVEKRVLWKKRNLTVADPALDFTTSSKGEIDGGKKSDLHKRKQYQSPKMRPIDEKGYSISKRISLS